MITVKEGDRVETGSNGEQMVTTPSFPVENPHNFGPVSNRDNIVFTSERPGGDPVDKTTKIPTLTVVEPWVKYMTTTAPPDRAIKHVIILLGDDELADYEPPGLISAYEAAGIVPYHIPMSANDSHKAILAKLDELYSQNERVIAHCTHGMGRSGRVAAGVSVCSADVFCRHVVDLISLWG